MVAPSYPMAGFGGGGRRPRLRPHAGMIVGGRYRLWRRLGQGGVGEVWEARPLHAHPDHTARVAIKLLLDDLGRDAVSHERFLREGRLAAVLDHPHIVQVYEVGGAQTSMPFMIMECLWGPSLDDMVRNHGALPWEQAKPILLQIGSALEHAHSARIVHHDVKPSNIVLASAPGQPICCKLVDFGIARRNLVDETDIALTIEGQILGSPGYISPEQMRGRRANHRSDLYGLGATAYHLLTGRPPVVANTLPALLHATLYEPPPPLGSIPGSWLRRRKIEALLRRALSKDPGERFVSARHMAHAIASI